jgi:hypothetical protein
VTSFLTRSPTNGSVSKSLSKWVIVSSSVAKFQQQMKQLSRTASTVFPHGIQGESAMVEQRVKLGQCSGYHKSILDRCNMSLAERAMWTAFSVLITRKLTTVYEYTGWIVEMEINLN